jgi:phenylacetic acid degradation operon negative regulatory protein
MASATNPRYDVPRHLSAKALVLDFLSTRAPRELSAQAILSVGTALGFSEQNLRMALTRLVEESAAVSSRRGLYRLSPGGEAMRLEVRKWRAVGSLTRPWTGGWIAVFDAPVPRSDRSAMRRHEQAMRLRGMRELHAGLWIRPANLRDTVADVREQLIGLGLHPAALVASLNDLDVKSANRATGLWETASTLAAYKTLNEELHASAARISKIPMEAAAAESLILGRDVIRHINLDPLLPDELMPQRPLTTLVRAMSDYDALARTIWRAFMRLKSPRD